jgi:hypothetical protein
MTSPLVLRALLAALKAHAESAAEVAQLVEAAYGFADERTAAAWRDYLAVQSQIDTITDHQNM